MPLTLAEKAALAVGGTVVVGLVIALAPELLELHEAHEAAKRKKAAARRAAPRPQPSAIVP